MTWRLLPDYLERERHVLEHRFVRKQLEVLEDAADIATQIRHAPVAHVRKILIGDVDMALRGLDLADEHADEGGFAGTGMTDQKHELAGEDLQGDVVEGGLVRLSRVHLGHMVERDDGVPDCCGVSSISSVGSDADSCDVTCRGGAAWRLRAFAGAREPHGSYRSSQFAPFM